jgi:hypothetical protein
MKNSTLTMTFVTLMLHLLLLFAAYTLQSHIINGTNFLSHATTSI